jgi:hypothetical protein
MQKGRFFSGSVYLRAIATVSLKNILTNRFYLYFYYKNYKTKINCRHITVYVCDYLSIFCCRFDVQVLLYKARDMFVSLGGYSTTSCT